MKIAEIINIIETIAPLWAQASWDLSGLQVASARAEAKKIAVCLDPLPERLEKALQMGADFILSHHPLSLKPGLPNSLDAWHDALKLLLCADTPLYAAHTSLDVNVSGPAGWLGKALGLRNMRCLEETHAPDESFMLGLGFGLVGDLPAATPQNDFLREILRLLGLAELTLCGPPAPGLVKRVAFCGGSGSSLCEAAFRAGAEIFITGDIKYHTALEVRLAIADVGHFSIENEMMRKMALVLQERMPGLSVFFLDAEQPFRHFPA